MGQGRSVERRVAILKIISMKRGIKQTNGWMTAESMKNRAIEE